MAVSVGTVFGILMLGTFVDTVHTVNGIPIHMIGPGKAAEVLTRDPSALRSQTSLVFDRSRMTTVDGIWPQFVMLLMPVLFAITLAHIEISRLASFAQVGLGRRVLVLVIFALGLVAALIALFQAIGLIPVIGWVAKPSAVPFGMWMAASTKVALLGAFATGCWGLHSLNQRLLRRPAAAPEGDSKVDSAT
jgi:hypothetical protein